MRLLIELPTWLGDAIMATPAIENLINHFDDVELTILGSFVSTKLFINHPKVVNIIEDKTKNSKNRYLEIYKLSKKIKNFDMCVSFRSSFSSKLLFFLSGVKQKYNYKKIHKEKHQVLKYNEYINSIINEQYKANDLKIYFEKEKYKKPTFGINPGATYGSAKRWYPDEFAKVAIAMSKTHDILIFGGPGEKDIANDIEKKLRESDITNYLNLAGKTSIPELIKYIGGLSLFITNDSGPMHVAAAFKIPTIAIFGPTKYSETNQWNNPNEVIITKNLDCAPCMKRVCPLSHHDCMKLITAEDILVKI